MSQNVKYLRQNLKKNFPLKTIWGDHANTVRRKEKSSVLLGPSKQLESMGWIDQLSKFQQVWRLKAKVLQTEIIELLEENYTDKRIFVVTNSNL